MAFTLKPYLAELNKLQNVFMGVDGWLYGDIRGIKTKGVDGMGSETIPTSLAHFEPYVYKGVVYLKFVSWAGQGFENHYLSVDKTGQLGLYNWFGATGWKLDFENHLVSLYNGRNVALAGDTYKADNNWPGLQFRREDNPELFAALTADNSPFNSLEMERTATYGGTGGSAFDGALPKGATHIMKILLHVGSQINAILPWYTDSSGGLLLTPNYGGPGTNAGSWVDIGFDLDEQITEVSGRADTLVRQLTFKTSKGKTFGPYGPATGTAFSVTGKPILGFFGRGGAAIDQIGFKRLNTLKTVRTPAYGGTGGSVFDGTPPPGAATLSKLQIHAGSQINSITAEWWDAGGGPIGRGYYGGSGQYAGTWYEQLLFPGEYFTEVSGMADTAVRQITFKTNWGNKFGPFGTAQGTPFSITGKNIVGFFGRGGWGIDQLGFVVIAPAAPKASAGLEFNGVDTHIIYDGPLPLGQQVTLEMWARGVPKESLLFWLTDDARRRQFSAHLPYIDGNVYFDAAADEGNNYDRIVKAAAPHDPNAWSHWAFVRNAATGRMAIYKDGVVFLEATGAVRPMATCNRFVLGGDGDGNWRHAGAIAEVRLWNTERTAAQIKDNMNRVIQGPDTGLVLSWSLDGIGADLAVMDGSGAGRNGKLMGANKSVTPPAALAT